MLSVSRLAYAFGSEDAGPLPPGLRATATLATRAPQSVFLLSASVRSLAGVGGLGWAEAHISGRFLGSPSLGADSGVPRRTTSSVGVTRTRARESETSVGQLC